MATTADIVERAFRKIGKKAEDQDITADEMSHGVDTLNMMLAGWRLQGVDTFLHELDPAAEFPLAIEFHEGVVYNLAARLSPDYMIPPGFDPDGFFRAIQNAYLRIEEAKMPLALRRTSSQRRIRL